VLVIAKLDRLARSVALISNLMQSGVEFVACDNPHANKLMVHLLAAFVKQVNCAKGLQRASTVCQ
jgi:intracellular sulfur oxidation DsrE/DsrF family protein